MTRSVLTKRALGDYRHTWFAGFSCPSLVLGNDPELVLLTFKQVGHVQFVCRWFDLKWNPAPADVCAALDDVPGDWRSTVRTGRSPRQMTRGTSYFRHLRYTRNTRQIYQSNAQQRFVFF